MKYTVQVQAIVDHHHADVKTASKVRFAEPGSTEPAADDAPSPPLTDSEDKDKDKDDKVNMLARTDCTHVNTLFKRAFT